MSAEIIMPKMGDAMTEGKVVRWYKKAGDAVKKGEPVLEIETDKVNLDLEAEQDGTLGELTAQEGQMVEVGGQLATILAPGEKAAEPQRRVTDKKDSVKHTTGEYAEAIETKGPRRDRTQGAPASTPAGEAASRRLEGAEDGAPPAAGTAARQRSSPLARKMARELGVDLKTVQGSGPGGRIVAKDIRKGPAAVAREDQSIPLSAMRRTIAKRLAESIGPIPHFFLTADYDVTNLAS